MTQNSGIGAALSLKAILATVIAMVISSAVPVAAGSFEWTSHGPPGGNISALAVSPATPTTILAAASSGVFRSTNGANDWQHVFMEPYIWCFAFDHQTPSTIYAGGSNGVYRSTDSGISWASISSGLPQGVLCLAVDPTNPTTLYAGLSFQGVYKSTNGGLDWSAVNNGLTVTSVSGLVVHPDTAGTVYAATWAGVCKTTDGGATWLPQATSPNEAAALVMHPSDTATLYVASDSDGVYRTTDGGASWTSVSSGLSVIGLQDLAIDPQQPDTLYIAGRAGGLYKTSNGGASWFSANSNINSYQDEMFAVAVDPVTTGTCYAGSRTAVWKTTTGGTSWSAVNSGLNALEVLSLASDPQTAGTVYAGTWDAGVFKTTDSGASWAPVNTGLLYPRIHCLAVDPQTPTTVYAGTWGGVFKTTDGGLGWALTSLSSVHIDALAIDPLAPGTIYAGSYLYGLFKTTDGGASWVPSDTGLPDHINAIVVDPSDSSIIFTGTQSNGVFKSTDGGATWSSSNNGLTDGWISALAIDPAAPDTIYAGTINGQSLFKSTNGGTSWSQANVGLSHPAETLAVDPTTPSTLYAATARGAYQSTDGAGSWTALNDGLTLSNLDAIAVDSGLPTIYAGSAGHGVYRYTMLQAGIDVVPTAGLITTEAGGTAQLSVVLTTLPSADVRVTLASSDPSEGSADPSELVFSSSSGLIPQTVTVTGANDSAVDGDVAYSIVLGPVTSSDGDYNGVDPADVSLVNLDDDTVSPSIIVTPTEELETTEAGGTDTFSVVLGIAPTANVSLSIASSDESEGEVSPEMLLFTPGNALVPQTVTVTGVSDAEDDGDVVYSIIIGPASSTDSGYDGLDPDDLPAVNIAVALQATIPTLSPAGTLLMVSALMLVALVYLRRTARPSTK